MPTKYQLADEPSRDIRKAEEFLPQPYFEYVERLAGICLSVDCMATQANAKCPEYIGIRPTELENTPYFQGKRQIFIDFLQVTRHNLVGKNLYIFPPKTFLEKTAAHVRNNFLNHPFVMIFHRWEELPLSLAPILAHKKSILVLLSRDTALTYFPAEKEQFLTHLPDGKPLKKPISLRGQPNVRPRALMAIFHCCQPITTLKKCHGYWSI